MNVSLRIFGIVSVLVFTVFLVMELADVLNPDANIFTFVRNCTLRRRLIHWFVSFAFIFSSFLFYLKERRIGWFLLNFSSTIIFTYIIHTIIAAKLSDFLFCHMTILEELPVIYFIAFLTLLIINVNKRVVKTFKIKKQFKITLVYFALAEIIWSIYLYLVR